MSNNYGDFVSFFIPLFLFSAGFDFTQEHISYQWEPAIILPVLALKLANSKRMSDNNTIKTSIQGIEITLLFGPLAIDLVASELKRLEEHDHDNYIENAELLTTPLIVFCGYYSYCQASDIPVLFTFEDFCKWANGRMALHEGRQEVAQIYSLYIKSDPFLCQDSA